MKMKIFENIELCIELNNYYFSKIGKDYRKILENGGLVEVTIKKKIVSKPWYEVIMFENETDYNEWKEKCIERISKMFSNKKQVEEEFDFFDLLHGPVQKYLLDRERKESLFGV